MKSTIQKHNETSRSGGRRISQWCADYGLSKATYYRMQAAGTAPETLSVGRIQIITDEADAAWLEVTKRRSRAASQ